MATIGKIERVPLREVWRHEAHDLTVWLEENVDVLNDVLGLSLVSAEREQNAGAFSVDLVAEDDEGPHRRDREPARTLQPRPPRQADHETAACSRVRSRALLARLDDQGQQRGGRRVACWLLLSQ